MAGDSVMVRVSRATKARMEAEVRRLVAATVQGRSEAGSADANANPAFLGMTYDALINRLLDLDENTRRRQRESAARRRKGPEQDNDPAVSNHGGEE